MQWFGEKPCEEEVAGSKPGMEGLLTTRGGPRRSLQLAEQWKMALARASLYKRARLPRFPETRDARCCFIFVQEKPKEKSNRDCWLALEGLGAGVGGG